MTQLSPEIESTYEVLLEMGGGMGAVYKVRHRLFGETRVIKVMHAALSDNESLKSRFLSEAKRGKQLRHRNIAAVLDFLIGSNGKPYLVMEYVDGVNLREFARRRGPLDAASVVDIGTQTLAALGYLHECNLVHRDISPDNLMLTQSDDGTRLVKLIDFGISKSLEETTALTQVGSFMGKIAYASPEQFGGLVDARSDFYSLGVVLYELLTGAMPLTGPNTAALILAHCQKPPRPFSETDRDGRVPEALRRVVLKALAKDPFARYQTASEFAAALQAAVSSANATHLRKEATTIVDAPLPKTISAPPQPAAPTLVSSAPVPTRRSPGTPPVVITLAFVALAALLGAAILELRQILNARSQQTTPSGQAAGTSVAVVAPKPEVSTTIPRDIQVPVQPDTATTTTTSTGIALPLTVITDHQRTDTAPAQVAPDLTAGDRQRKEAMALSNAHDWERAVTAWRAFIRDYSGFNAAADHAAYYNLGVAYEALRQWSDAVDSFERAKSTDVTGADTENLLRLARCYGKLGRWPDAVTNYQHVLQIDPTNEVAKRSLPAAQQQSPSHP
jgi:serine/threonine-protein kinase